MNKCVVVIITMLFLVTTNRVATIDVNQRSLISPDDNWPMYHHDAANTGFSSSLFPNSFNQSWNRTYADISNSTFWSQFSSPIIVNGKMFVLGHEGNNPYIYALSEDNANLIWKTELTQNSDLNYLAGSNSPAVANGKVFVCLGSFVSLPCESKLIALDENTGTILWEKTLSETSAYCSVSLVDDTVVVGGHFTFFIPLSKIYIFDATKGDLIWRKTLIGYLETTPVVSDDKVFVTTGRHSGAVLGLHFPIFSGRSRVYAFNLSNGNHVWTKWIEGHVLFSSPALADDTLFIPSNIIIGPRRTDRRMYALDIETGKRIWYRHIEQEYSNAWPTSISTPAIAYGAIFFTDSDGRLFALDTTDGDILWERDIIQDAASLSSPSFISPIIVDHKIIAAAREDTGSSDKFEIGLFNASNGEMIWSIECSELELATTPYAIANGKLYVNGITGIYVFD